MCARWSSLPLNATWHVLQVYGCEAGWGPAEVTDAVTVAMAYCCR